jgi:hypothetical protein
VLKWIACSSIALLALLSVTITVGQASSSTRVERMSQRVLEREARKVAVHGGVTGSCWGCATPYMKRLSYELIDRAFSSSYRSWAHCIVNRESGYNPGAVSRTDDHGLPQFNRPSHSWINYTKVKRDPPYAVACFVRLSRGGSNQGPWGYSC